jgi:pyruvate/2-oxoglutarate dehydrogenase complex dihydrolipoamide dehydrogenase (E3) component
VPWLAGALLTSIGGDGRVERATVRRVDDQWRPYGAERTFAVDAVCLGYGLIPSLELVHMCGCRVTFSAELRGWVPIRTRRMESSVPGIFIAGDCAGIAGALVAAEEGRIAGITAAEQLGHIAPADAARQRGPHDERRQQLERFRRAFDVAYALKPAIYDLGERDTIACRCEDVTFSELEAAVADGAEGMAQLRAYTRCGMGACQGRICHAPVREWLAARMGCPLEGVGSPPVGMPAKPVVTMGALAVD